MKRYFILLVIVSNLSSVAMEDPADLQKVYEKLTEAFQAFGLNSEGYSINTYHQTVTPEADVPRWSVTSSHIEITKDIRANPELTEFATYCAVADIKNYGHLKRVASLIGIYTAPVVPLAAAAVTTSKPWSPFLFALPLVPAAVMAYCKLDSSLLSPITWRLEIHAFTHACKRLAEQKKFKTLATYYSFAQHVKHAPLKWEDQREIIIASLSAQNHSISTNKYPASIESHILDNSQNPAEIVCIGSYPSGQSK